MQVASIRPSGRAQGCDFFQSTKSYRGHVLLRQILLALIIFCTGPGVVLAQTTGGSEATQSVVVQGNRRIEVATILAYMDLQPNQQVTASDLNSAVRRLFETGLFRDVSIIPADGRLIVQVVENPTINEIAFEGNSALSDEDLSQIISLRSRMPFTASAAESDAQQIIEIYRRTGRYGAEVEPVIIERSENRVDLVFQIHEGDLTEVSSIDFVGNKTFSDSRLRSVIETSETGIFALFISSDIYDPDRLELDKELLRQFYTERGYADFSILSASAELSPDRSGFFITFNLVEGEPYTFGNFDVEVNAKGLDPADFLALIPDDLSGDTYDSSEVEEIANEMTDLAGQKGFAFVQVRPSVEKDSENRIIDITFELNEGPKVFIERIDIEGNTQTLDRVIRRNIDLVEGDVFDARRIRDARTKIRALDYFTSVDIDTEQGSEDDRAVLKVKVKEKSTGNLSFGLGYSSSAGPIGNVSVTEQNFLGRGQQVNLRVTAAGDTQVYSFSFNEPRFLDRDLSVGFESYFIDDNREDESNFRISRLGFIPNVGFPLSRDTRLSLHYTFKREDIRVSQDASPAIRIDDGVRYTSGVGYRLFYDKRNDKIEPTSGYLVRFDQDVAGIGGDARYINNAASVKGWTSFFDEDLILSLEVEGGAIVGFGRDVRVNERYFLGGESLRGFGDEGAGPRDIATDDSLGGKYMLASRLEASFPLGLPEDLGVFGGAFVDAGTLFGLDHTRFNGGSTVIDDDPYLRLSAGGLLFIATPFGPLKLSLGYPIVRKSYDDKEIFRLSVGTRF